MHKLFPFRNFSDKHHDFYLSQMLLLLTVAYGLFIGRKFCKLFCAAVVVIQLVPIEQLFEKLCLLRMS